MIAHIVTFATNAPIYLCVGSGLLIIVLVTGKRQRKYQTSIITASFDKSSCDNKAKQYCLALTKHQITEILQLGWYATAITSNNGKPIDTINHSGQYEICITVMNLDGLLQKKVAFNTEATWLYSIAQKNNFDIEATR